MKDPEREDTPNPWCIPEEPLPENKTLLVAQIEAWAAARRRDAHTHPKPCTCDACAVRRYEKRRHRAA